MKPTNEFALLNGDFNRGEQLPLSHYETPNYPPKAAWELARRLGNRVKPTCISV